MITVNSKGFGAAVQSICFPDKNSAPIDVVLGYDDVQSYENGSCCYGAAVGRFANRIGGARFTLCVDAEYHCYGEEGNELRHVFHIDQRLPETHKCNDDECAYFMSKVDRR